MWIRHLAVTNLQLHGGQRPCSRSDERSGGGGRDARATSSRLRTFSGFPPAIHPRESPAAAGSAAIIRQAQELSRFAALTLRQIDAPRNTKKLFRCEETVEDVSSLWKSEENQELILRSAFTPITYDAHVGIAASAVRDGEAERPYLRDFRRVRTSEMVVG